ncbi:1619_t:CDS:1, partial [Ambispora gerdemannii]
NIWKVLKDNVQNYEAFPRSVDELKIALKKEWENLLLLFLKMLFPQCQELKQYLSQMEGQLNIN